MSAAGVTDATHRGDRGRSHDLIVVNFANPDMVGHTGVWQATLRAVETIDGCLGRIVAALAAGDARDPVGPGSLPAVTADHGNADAMRDAAGNPVTAHSLNLVPFPLAGRAVTGRTTPRWRPVRRRSDRAGTGRPRALAGDTGRSLLDPAGGNDRYPVISSGAVPTGGRTQ